MQNTPTSFLFIFVFSIQLIARINFADDWIRTTDLWCRMRPLYQLHHNHFPTLKQVPKRRLKNCLSDVGQNSVSLHGAEQQYFTPILQTHSLSLSLSPSPSSHFLSHTHIPPSSKPKHRRTNSLKHSPLPTKLYLELHPKLNLKYET